MTCGRFAFWRFDNSELKKKTFSEGEISHLGSSEQSRKEEASQQNEEEKFSLA